MHDLGAAVLDPDEVAVEAQLDALMDERRWRAVEGARVLEVAVERNLLARRPAASKPIGGKARSASRSIANRSTTMWRAVAWRRGSATRWRQSA